MTPGVGWRAWQAKPTASPGHGTSGSFYLWEQLVMASAEQRPHNVFRLAYKPGLRRAGDHQHIGQALIRVVPLDHPARDCLPDGEYSPMDRSISVSVQAVGEKPMCVPRSLPTLGDGLVASAPTARIPRLSIDLRRAGDA